MTDKQNPKNDKRTGNGPKEPLWDIEKIRGLDDQGIKNLKANAERRANHSISELCDIVLRERRPPPSAGITKHDAIARSITDKREEKDSAELLENLAIRLLERYDLSKETAKRRSAEVKGFVAHSFLSKAMRAKIGGGQKAGKLVFDRYISYRIGNDLCLFSVVKIPNSNEIAYEVFATKHRLPNPLPISEMHPYLGDGGRVGYSEWGCRYSTFDEAASLFEKILSEIAPPIAT